MAQDGALEAKTVFAELGGDTPSQFVAGSAPDAAAAVPRVARAAGPLKEVFFPQTHTAGRMGSIDFTNANELGVTIAGAVFAHMFFHMVLPFNGWHFVQLAFSETFEALVRGLQGALFELGGVPERVRMDNLSAATHELKESGGRTFTTRFGAVLDHFGIEGSRISPAGPRERGRRARAWRAQVDTGPGAASTWEPGSYPSPTTSRSWRWSSLTRSPLDAPQDRRSAQPCARCQARVCLVHATPSRCGSGRRSRS
ncbi:MAG: hypothetical protein U0353_12765 [Sandaracinus sp.]